MIVLDASVLIASLVPQDIHHAAGEALFRTTTQGLLVNTVTLAEILVSPIRAGRVDEVLATLTDLGVREAEFPPDAARTLAGLRVDTGQKMPDCCVLLTALERRASIASFDDRLLLAAAKLGLPIENPAVY